MRLQKKDPETYLKIKTLFELRHLPEMLAWQERDDDPQMLDYLFSLQAAIYRLDKYLERQWQLERTTLHSLWKDIFSILEEKGITGEELDQLCRDLRTYQEMEERMRRGVLYYNYPISMSYSIKSCDVRLARQIILRQSGRKDQLRMLEDWILFDYVTEVQDDLEDLEEDIVIYNGNRLLHCLLAKGKKETLREYSRFLGWIGNAQKKAMNQDPNDQQAAILNWTASQLEETGKLLTDTLGSRRDLRLDAAIIKRALSA